MSDDAITSFTKFCKAAICTLALISCSNDSSDVREARRHVEDYSISAVSFRSMDQFFPVDFVEAAPGAAIPTQIQTLDLSVTFADQAMNLEQALKHTDTNALLVIKDGVVVYERYLNEATEESRFVSWSMAKSFTSMLVGMALESGTIENIDDPIEKYVPELKDTAYMGVTLRQLLQMRAGTDYHEVKLFGKSHVDLLAEQSLFAHQTSFIDISELGLSAIENPGEVFNYSTLNSSILGRAVENATGQTLADYMSETLWKPAGMQHSGFWMMDGPKPEGKAFGGGGFNATLRDYGRIGLLMLQNGRMNDTQILPEEWVTLSSTHEGPDPVIPKSPRGYGYSWWTFLNTQIYEAVGIHGQFISIDPATNTVIVKLSHWPKRGAKSYAVENHQLLSAIRAELSQN